MKKLLFILLIMVVLVAALAAAAWHYMPAIGAYALAKIVGGQVEVSRAEVTYAQGTFVVDLHDLVLKGARIAGSVKDARLRVKIRMPLYVTYLGLSDFILTMPKSEGKMILPPVPVELAEIRRGTVTYGGQKYLINEIKISNFNTGGTLEFSVDGTAEGLGSIKMKGGGPFDDKRSDLKGDFHLSDVNISRVFGSWQGRGDYRGDFTYVGDKLSVRGSIDASEFSMKEAFLKIPITAPRKTCDMSLVVVGTTINGQLDKLFFKDIPIRIAFAVGMVGRKGDLTRLELSSDFLPVSDVEQYINTDVFAKKVSMIMSRLRAGDVRMKKLVYALRKPFYAELDVRHVKAGYKDVELTEIEGSLILGDKAMTLSRLRGTFSGNTFLYSVSGTVPYSDEKDIEVKGNFTGDIRQLARFVDLPGITLTSGTTEGSAEFRGREGGPFKVAGEGTLNSTGLTWKRIPLTAAGSYSFQENGITFNPLTLTGGKTELVVKGDLKKNRVRAAVQGMADASQLKSLLDVPYPLEGAVHLHGTVEKDGPVFAMRGSLGMNDLQFEMPGFMKKQKGMESSAELSVRGEKGKLRIDQLSYRLGAIVLDLQGDVIGRKAANLHVAMDVQGVENVASLFLLQEQQARGDVKLDLRIEEMQYPLSTLPSVTGYIVIRNGFLRLPSLVKPFTEIQVRCDFKGDRFNLDAGGLRAGSSILRKGYLSAQGLEAPAFTLSVDMDHFDPSDFAMRQEGKFEIPVIAAESLMGRVKGTILFRAARLNTGSITATGLELKSGFSNRMFAVSEWKADAFGGTMNLQGGIDLSGSVPRVTVSGKVSGIKGGEILKLFDPKSEILEGSGLVSGKLEATGRNADELLGSMGGSVTTYSRDGVIRRWNLLSKIFGLLNVYDFLRGKVNLWKTGLPYTKMGATFEGKDGVFQTDSFLIDSPSMVITGRGKLDIAEKTVDARVAVSPLVAIDRFISKIPILRSIIREKEEGFLYVTYDVKGPLSDPEVTSSYIQSMGGRALGILRNILQFPIEVLEQ